MISDIHGTSGRDMLNALTAGQRGPRALAQLARGTMRRKIRRLEEALQCSFFTSEHAAVLAMMLTTIDHYTTQIDQLTAKIEALAEPYLHQVGQLDQIDGIRVICAQDIIAEIGVDMTVFPTAGHLVSLPGTGGGLLGLRPDPALPPGEGGRPDLPDVLLPSASRGDLLPLPAGPAGPRALAGRAGLPDLLHRDPALPGRMRPLQHLPAAHRPRQRQRRNLRPGDVISPQLQPLARALAQAETPFKTIQWLKQSPTAQMLARLAAGDQPMSHSLLDELPPDRKLHYIRQIMVQTADATRSCCRPASPASCNVWPPGRMNA